MSQRPTHDIAVSLLSERWFLSAGSLWQAEVVYSNELIKIWLSSPPSKTKSGTKVRYHVHTEPSAQNLFLAFVLKAAKTKGVDFLYNDLNQSVEVTFQRAHTALFQEFFEALPALGARDTPILDHSLSRYWQDAIIQLYY